MKFKVVYLHWMVLCPVDTSFRWMNAFPLRGFRLIANTLCSNWHLAGWCESERTVSHTLGIMCLMHEVPKSWIVIFFFPFFPDKYHTSQVSSSSHRWRFLPYSLKYLCLLYDSVRKFLFNNQKFLWYPVLDRISSSLTMCQKQTVQQIRVECIHVCEAKRKGKCG